MSGTTTKQWSPIASQMHTHITEDTYDLYVQLPWDDDLLDDSEDDE